MSLLELLIIAIGLSMDAFAVSIGKGLSVTKIKLSHALKVGLWFGGFQALMPLIGYLLGSTFADIVSAYDHWVAWYSDTMDYSNEFAMWQYTKNGKVPGISSDVDINLYMNP